MKRFTSIICSVAFALFGIGLAITGPNLSNAQAINAAEVHPTIVSAQLPIDFQLSHGMNASDTVYVTKTDTVIKQVTKVKWKKQRTPSPMVEASKPDTVMVSVPVYYLITCKQDSSGKNVSVFETQEVNDCERLNEILNCNSSENGEK